MSEQAFTLDVQKRNKSYELPTLAQASTMTLELSLTKGGADWTIPSGWSGILHLYDHDTDLTTIQIASVSNVANVMSFDFTADNTAEDGRYRAELVITDGSELISWSKGRITIDPSTNATGSTAGVSGPVLDFDAFSSIINYLTGWEAGIGISLAVVAGKLVITADGGPSESTILSCKVNEAGGITKGQVVYISGATGGFAQVSLATNDDFSKAEVLAVATETKTNGQTIIITRDGLFEDVDTSSFTEGQILYLGTAGAITGTHPTGTAAVQRIGHAVKINASTGSLLVELNPLTVIDSLDGTVRHQLVNENTGTASASAYTIVNDAGHHCSMSLTGENFPTFTEVFGLYTQGYGDMRYHLDGNHNHEWITDTTDAHNFMATVKMALSAAGNLTITGTVDGHDINTELNAATTIQTEATATVRKTLTTYDPDGPVVGLTRVIQADLAGILWTLVATDVTLDASWVGLPYTADPAGTLTVNLLMADVSAIVPALNTLGEVGGLLRIGDGTTTGGLAVGAFVQGTDHTYDIRPINEGATAGNARGAFSVELQVARTLATEVASGLSATIGGGGSNTASGEASTIGGGGSNKATAQYAVVGGGAVNTASGVKSGILGGFFNNTNSLESAFIVGSNITASAANTCHVENLISLGSADIATVIELTDTTTSTTGVVTKGGTRFLHNFAHPTGDSAVPDGRNTFVGKTAGNFTLGSTATSTSHGSYNTGLGETSLDALTQGHNNMGAGYNALGKVTTGTHNMGVGSHAVRNVVTASFNAGVGGFSLAATTGAGNTAIGYSALISNVAGTNNIGIGYLVDSSGASATNEIVIGYNATGLGSNTVVLGNDSVVTTYLKGDVDIATGNLSVAAGITTGYVAKTAIYTATASDSTINCTANTFTVTLPTAVGITGRRYDIKNSGTGTITVDGDGTETIDGGLTAVLSTQYDSITVQSDGANWIII